MLKIKSKYEQIYDFLMEEIEKRNIGDLLPCETAVANELAVNRMTVSKVMSALKTQGYIIRKQGRGSEIVKKRHSTAKGIIAVLPIAENKIHDNYFSTLIDVIIKKCISGGYINTFTGCPEPGSDASFDYNILNSLASKANYLGALVLDPKIKHVKEWEKYFQYKNFPVVWVAMEPQGGNGMSFVDIDNRTAALKLMEILYARGCRKIAFITSSLNTYHELTRFSAYKEALEQLGLGLDQNYIFTEDSGTGLQRGYDTAQKLLQMPDPPDGFFVTGLSIIHGIRNFAKEQQIPKFFTEPVVTFDYVWEEADDNVIATAKQPVRQMAETAFDLVMDLASGRQREPVGITLKADIKQKDNSA